MKIEKYYNNIAKKYGNPRTFKEKFVKIVSEPVYDYFLKKYLPKNKNIQILDVGGGTGTAAIKLAKLGYNVTLIDISQGMLDIAKMKIKKTKLENKIKTIRINAEDLKELKNNSFDFILSLKSTLSYCNIEKALKELKRVAKKNAIFFLEVENKHYLTYDIIDFNGNIKEAIKILKTGKGTYPKEWGGHEIRAFDSSEFRQIFSKHKLKVKEIFSTPYVSEYLNHNTMKKILNNKQKLKELIKLEIMCATSKELVGASEDLVIIGAKK